MDSNNRGFTLIELIVVFAIITIIATGVTLKIASNVSAMKLDSAASQVRDHLRLAHEHAKLTQDRYCVSFDTSDNTYGVYESSDLVNPIVEPTSGNDISYDFDTDEHLDGVNIAISDFGSGSSGKIEFDALGQPYDGVGGSLLTSDATVTLSYDSNSAVIEIEPMTGLVNIQ